MEICDDLHVGKENKNNLRIRTEQLEELDKPPRGRVRRLKQIQIWEKGVKVGEGNTNCASGAGFLQPSAWPWLKPSTLGLAALAVRQSEMLSSKRDEGRVISAPWWVSCRASGSVTRGWITSRRSSVLQVLYANVKAKSRRWLAWGDDSKGQNHNDSISGGCGGGGGGYVMWHQFNSFWVRRW